MRKLLLFLLLVPLFACAQSPFDGTWKFNMSNAQFSEKPESFLLQNGEYTCSTCIPEVAVKADGADHNVPDARGYDTLAVKQVDDKTIQQTRKKDGKVVVESTSAVLPDGKTLVLEWKGYPPGGQPVTGKAMLTRVSEGPKGAHAVSGSWRMAKLENVSEHVFTLKSTPGGLSMQTNTGESYEAKFDGEDYPLKGEDHAGVTVSLKRVNDNAFEETYKRDGKPIELREVTVHGNTMTLVSKNVRDGSTDTITADKQ